MMQRLESFVWFIGLILISFSSVISKELRVWSCSSPVARYTTYNCSQLGNVNGCYHLKHHKLYKACSRICNGAGENSGGEEECNERCSGYLGADGYANCTLATLVPTTMAAPTTPAATPATMPEHATTPDHAALLGPTPSTTPIGYAGYVAARFFAFFFGSLFGAIVIIVVISIIYGVHSGRPPLVLQKFLGLCNYEPSRLPGAAGSSIELSTVSSTEPSTGSPPSAGSSTGSTTDSLLRSSAGRPTAASPSIEKPADGGESAEEPEESEDVNTKLLGRPDDIEQQNRPNKQNTDAERGDHEAASDSPTSTRSLVVDIHTLTK